MARGRGGFESLSLRQLTSTFVPSFCVGLEFEPGGFDWSRPD